MGGGLFLFYGLYTLDVQKFMSVHTKYFSDETILNASVHIESIILKADFGTFIF